MPFRDQKLVCDNCGRAFFFTVTEQRHLAERLGEDGVVPPDRCPDCRRQVSASAPPREKSASRPLVAQRASPVAAPSAPSPADSEFPLEEEGVEVKLIGTVKWFSLEKGYGFITKADGQDVFFHRADVLERPVSRISEDQRVEFQLRYTEKGPEAFNVSILPAP